MKKVNNVFLSILITLSCIIGIIPSSVSASPAKYSVNSVPPFSDSPYVEINGNIPSFTANDITTKAFENYSDLDSLGRCGVAFANICKEIMPTESRGAIGMVKPSGWHTVKYDFVDGKYLYNRCHLIGYQLAGENANTKNLITGTRYLNTQGMLPFEDEVANYVENTGNHVLYRVTPIYSGRNLVASGVQMEAYSVEDKGSGISFNVYCYNNQPGVTIDYSTGDSWLSSEKKENTNSNNVELGVAPPDTSVDLPANSQNYNYVLNKNTKKFHNPDCESVNDMKEKNKEYFKGTREEAISKGYTPCGRCHP